MVPLSYLWFSVLGWAKLQRLKEIWFRKNLGEFRKAYPPYIHRPVSHCQPLSLAFFCMLINDFLARDNVSEVAEIVQVHGKWLKVISFGKCQPCSSSLFPQHLLRSGFAISARHMFLELNVHNRFAEYCSTRWIHLRMHEDDYSFRPFRSVLLLSRPFPQNNDFPCTFFWNKSHLSGRCAAICQSIRMR